MYTYQAFNFPKATVAHDETAKALIQTAKELLPADLRPRFVGCKESSCWGLMIYRREGTDLVCTSGYTGQLIQRKPIAECDGDRMLVESRDIKL